MSGFWSKLFGGGSSPAAPEPKIHLGFSITPNPEKVSGGYRLGALIEKDGQSHQVIRADTLLDKDEAIKASIAKAEQVIKEQGDALFR